LLRKRCFSSRRGSPAFVTADANGVHYVHDCQEIWLLGFSCHRRLAASTPVQSAARYYEIEVILQATALDSVGFVRDYRELSALKKFLDETVDHKHLNDVLGHDSTTAETLSKWLYDWCKGIWPEVVAVRVSEAPSTWAEYRP
jgi:6-pyruvoyltetrahydropterin/6-carboxytetrahydropterin synthase